MPKGNDQTQKQYEEGEKFLEEKYKTDRLKDPKLPPNPKAFYKDEWIDWKTFYGIN